MRATTIPRGRIVRTFPIRKASTPQAPSVSSIQRARTATAIPYWTTDNPSDWNRKGRTTTSSAYEAQLKAVEA